MLFAGSIFASGRPLVGKQVAGGQQPQVGYRGRAGAVGACNNPNGAKIGLSRKWKAFGKKATMKIPRNMQVLRKLYSNGIAQAGYESEWTL